MPSQENAHVRGESISVEVLNSSVRTESSQQFAQVGDYGINSTIHKFGRNPIVGATEEEVWTGSTAYPWQTAASPLRVAIGGNAADISTGAGARTVTLLGLDANFNEISETISLNGAAQSAPTAQSFIRCHRASVTECGTYGGGNVGIINIATVPVGTVISIIPAGIGQTQQATWTVSAGATAFMSSAYLQNSGTGVLDFRLYRRTGANVFTAPFGAKRVFSEFAGVQPGQVLIVKFDAYPRFTEYTDVWISAIRNGSQNSSCVTMFDLMLT